MAVPEGLALVSYEDEAMAKRVCAFLVKQFPYCKDGEAVVFKNPVEKSIRRQLGSPEKYEQPYWWCNDYIVGFIKGAEYWKTFSTSIERVQNAAGDFVAGYQAAQKEVS